MHVVPVVYLNGVRHFPPPAPPPLLPGQRRKSLRDPGTGEEGGSLQQTARQRTHSKRDDSSSTLSFPTYNDKTKKRRESVGKAGVISRRVPEADEQRPQRQGRALAQSIAGDSSLRV